MKKQKNSIHSLGVSEHITKRKAIDSVLKNPKSFSISKSVFSEIQLILVSKLVYFLARKILVT